MDSRTEGGCSYPLFLWLLRLLLTLHHGRTRLPHASSAGAGGRVRRKRSAGTARMTKWFRAFKPTSCDTGRNPTTTSNCSISIARHACAGVLGDGGRGRVSSITVEGHRDTTIIAGLRRSICRHPLGAPIAGLGEAYAIHERNKRGGLEEGRPVGSLERNRVPSASLTRQFLALPPPPPRADRSSPPREESSSLAFPHQVNWERGPDPRGNQAHRGDTSSARLALAPATEVRVLEFCEGYVHHFSFRVIKHKTPLVLSPVVWARATADVLANLLSAERQGGCSVFCFGAAKMTAVAMV